MARRRNRRATRAQQQRSLQARARELRAELETVEQQLNRGSRSRPSGARAAPSSRKGTRRTSRGLLRSKLPPKRVYNTKLRRYLKPANPRGRKRRKWMALVEVTSQSPGGESRDYVLSLVMPTATPAQARKWDDADVERELRDRVGAETVFRALLGIFEWSPSGEPRGA